MRSKVCKRLCKEMILLRLIQAFSSFSQICRRSQSLILLLQLRAMQTLMAGDEECQLCIHGTWDCILPWAPMISLSTHRFLPQSGAWQDVSYLSCVATCLKGLLPGSECHCCPSAVPCPGGTCKAGALGAEICTDTLYWGCLSVFRVLQRDIPLTQC